METVNCNRASSNRQCVIDGEDDESPDIVISLQDAMKGVKKGDLIECIGCSTKKTRAFHTKESYPELFKKPKQAKKVTTYQGKESDEYSSAVKVMNWTICACNSIQLAGGDVISVIREFSSALILLLAKNNLYLEYKKPED